MYISIHIRTHIFLCDLPAIDERCYDDQRPSSARTADPVINLKFVRTAQTIFPGLPPEEDGEKSSFDIGDIAAP